MTTAMSAALAKAGVISEEKSQQVEGIPRNMLPFQPQIEEIEVLTKRLQEANAEVGIDGICEMMLFNSRMCTGEYSTAFSNWIKHLKHKVSQLA